VYFTLEGFPVSHVGMSGYFTNELFLHVNKERKIEHLFKEVDPVISFVGRKGSTSVNMLRRLRISHRLLRETIPGIR